MQTQGRRRGRGSWRSRGGRRHCTGQGHSPSSSSREGLATPRRPILAGSAPAPYSAANAVDASDWGEQRCQEVRACEPACVRVPVSVHKRVCMCALRCVGECVLLCAWAGTSGCAGEGNEASGEIPDGGHPKHAESFSLGSRCEVAYGRAEEEAEGEQIPLSPPLGVATPSAFCPHARVCVLLSPCTHRFVISDYSVP